MSLSEANLKELEEMGAQNVVLHLSKCTGADIGGFKTGNMARGGIIAWLADKDHAEDRMQRRILFWAVVAGIAGIAGVVAMILHR